VLIRYARRYVHCLDDAEDAYQRAMEIALTKAPVTEPARFLAWLYSVVRNEAIAVAKERTRLGLGRSEDAAGIADDMANGQSLEHNAEWRERYRGVQDALGSLSEQQRTCVMLQSAGLSYEQIAEMTGFSHRQIERSITRGRSRLHAWEDKLESGAACKELRPALERVVARSAPDSEVRRIGRHVRVCAGCRASIRQRLTTTETLAGLVPLVVITGASGSLAAPDPGLVIAYWERLTGAGMARAGQLLTTMLEAPAAGLARVGGAAVALAVAGLAVVPIAADALPASTEPGGDRPVEFGSIASAWPSEVLIAAAQASITSTAVPAPPVRPAPKPSTPRKPRPDVKPAPSAATTPAHATTRAAPARSQRPSVSILPATTPSTPAGEFGP
jgi:RNA polymerase sigma factor (sigma-70 family)